MDKNTAKAAFLLFDDYLDVCLGLTGKEHQDIYEKKKALKKELIHDKCTEDEYRTRDSELFLEYMQKVSK